MYFRDIRRRTKRIIGPTLSMCLVGYFTYHMVQGKRGILAWKEMETKLAIEKNTLVFLKEEQEKLERRIHLLRSSSLCSDMLEEQLRLLGFSHPQELVILHDAASVDHE